VKTRMINSGPGPEVLITESTCLHTGMQLAKPSLSPGQEPLGGRRTRGQKVERWTWKTCSHMQGHSNVEGPWHLVLSLSPSPRTRRYSYLQMLPLAFPMCILSLATKGAHRCRQQSSGVGRSALVNLRWRMPFPALPPPPAWDPAESLVFL
jgi:hypothetical protein